MPEAAGFSKDDFEAWKRSSKPPPLEDHEFDPADFDDWKKRRAAQAAITYPAEEPAGAKPAVPIVPGGTISPGRTALLPGREYGLSDAQRAAQAPGAEEPPAAPFRQGGILAAAEPREPPPKLAEAPHVRDPRVLDAITRYAEGDFSAPVTGTIGLLAQDLYKGRYPKGTPDRELVERTVKAAIWARHYKIGPDAVLKLLGDTPENRALAGWTAYLDEQAREHGAPSKQALFEKNFYRQNIPEGAAPPTTGERLGELPRRALHGAAGGVAAGLELPGQVLEMGGRALPPGPAAAATQAVGMSLRRLPQAARELLEEAIAKPPPPGSRDEGFLETMLQAGVEEASALYGMGYSPFVKAAGKLGRAAVPLLPAGALGEEVLGKKLSQAGQIGRQAGQAAVTMGAFQVPEALEVIDRLDRGEPPGDITGQMLHSAYLIGLFELVGRGKGLMRLQRIARSGMPNNPHLTAEQQGLIRAAAREALKGVPEALTREVGPRMEGPQFRLFKDQSIPDALREAVENIRFEEAKGPAETQRALAGRLGKLTPEQMLAETEELRLANAPGAAIRKWAGTLNRLGLTAALERASQKSPGGKMAMILTEELQRRQFGRPEQGPTVPYGKKGKPTFAESVSGEAPGEVIRSMRRIGTGGRRVPPAERPPRAEVPEEVAAPPSSVRPGGIRSPESGLLEGLREAGFDPQKLARAGVAEANRLWEEFHGAGTASERGRILEEFNGPRAVTEAPRAPGEKVITPVIPPPPAPVERGAPPPSVPPEAGPAPPAGPLDRQMADLFARGLPDKEIAKRLYNAGLVKSGEGTRIVREARERLDVPTDPEALRQWAEERVPAEQRQAIATAESELSKALGRTQYPNAAEAQEAIQGKLDRGTKLTPAERDVADALEALEKAHAGEQGFVDLEGAKRRKTGRPAAPGGASSIEAEGISREGISRVIARFRADTGKAAWFEEGRLKVADEADLPKLSELVYGRAFEEAEEPPQGKPAEKPPEKPPEPVPPEGKPPKAPPPPTTPGPKAPPPAPAQPPEPEPPTERPAAVDLGVVREGLSKIGSGIEEFDAVVNRREAAAIDRQARIEAKREVQADSLLRDVPTDKLPELFGADNRDRVHVGKVPTPLLGNGAKDWAAIEWLKRQKAKRLPPAEAAPLPPTPVPEAPRQERRASVRFPPSPETANATVEAVGGKMLAGLRKMQAEGIPMTDDAMREHLGDDATSSLILNGVLVRDKANPEVFLPVDMLRAKIGPVPEGPATIEAQLEALRRGDKPLMLIPKGQKAPVLDDKLFGRLSGPDGTWIFKRGAPKALLAELRKWKATGEPTPEADKARLLGYPSEKPAPGEPAVTVTGRTAAGVEAESQVVPPEKAEEAAEQVGKVAGPGGAVEVGGEEQARKVIEERQEAPKPAVRQEGKPFAPAASGGQSIVRTESFTGVETRWAVVDGDRLLTSSSEGYDQAIQPRNVKRAAVDAQREAIKAKPDFEALGEAYLASNGSPLVNKRSMVVSGNRRTEAILELYRDAPEVAKQYRAWIARNRQKFGLVDLSDEALAGMKRPVLVRLIERDFTPEQEVKFAEEANKSSTLEMAAAETASRDARALVADPDLMAKFMPGEDGKIDVASNRAFIKGFFGLLTPTERGDAITKEGAVSKQGIERIRLAIFSAAYGEGDVLERLAEGGDSEIKLVTTAMMAAAGPVIRVKGMAARDEIQKLDMSGEIGEAARALGRIRRTEKNVEKAIQSHGEQMFLGDPDPAHTQRIQTWLELMGLKSNGFHKSAAYMADLFKTYADIAEHTDPPGQGRLIGEAKNWTKEEVLAAAIVKVRDQYGKGPTIFESRSEEGEGVAPGGAEKQEGAPPEGEGKPEAFVYILTRNNGDRVDVRFASQDDLALFSYAMNPRAAEGNRLAEKLKIPRGQLDKAAADYRKAVMQIAAGGTAGPWGLTQVAAPAAVHPKPLAPERIEGPKAPSERNKDLDVLEKFFGGEEKPPEPPKGSLAQITIKTPPPEVLRAATTYGAALVRDEGLTKFDDWKARMIADVKSDRIGPFLDPIWKRIKVGNPDLAQKMEDAGAAIQPTKGPTAEGPKPPTAAGGPRPGVGSEQPVAGGGRKRQPIITIEPDRTSRVDVSAVDRDLVEHLDDHQQQGAAKAIIAMNNRPAGGGFLLGDGAGCIAAETRIYDPILGREKTVKELADLGRPCAVLSWNGEGFEPQMADAPFPKGVDDLYEVTLEDGGSVTVTREHRFLTPEGWFSLSDGLMLGHLLGCAGGLARSSSVRGRSTPLGDDPSSFGRVEDSQEHCSSDHRPGDGQPLIDSGSDPSPSPSPNDVRGRTRKPSRSDGRVTSPEHSRPHRLSAHRARSNFSPAGFHTRGASADRETSFASQESEGPLPAFERLHAQSVVGLASPQCSPGRFSPHEATALRHANDALILLPSGTAERSGSSRQGIAQDPTPFPRPSSERRPHRESLEESEVSPASVHSIRWVGILSVEFKRRAEFYDLQVPGYQNYVAEGMVHHNTGKTREILAVSEHYRRQGQSILIIAPAGTLKFKAGQLTGSYADDAKAMGVEFEVRGSGDLRPLKPGTINLTTYERFTPAVVDENTVLVFDESHKLANPWSDRSRRAERAIEKAGRVMFASATPMDKPGHIYYMMRAGLAEGRQPEQVLKDLGFIKTKLRTPKGDQIFTWEVNPSIGEAKVLERIDKAFAGLIERGFAVKREVSMERMSVRFQNTPIDDAAWDTLSKIYQGFDGDNARGIVRANMLMNMMRQLEPYKIPEAVRMASEALAAGHQIVIYVNRINYSEAARNIRQFNPATGRTEIVDRIVFAKSDGTMETLTKQLQAIGIKDIAHLHGRAAEFGAKSPGEEVEKFNSGKARVMLATPWSAAEGLNLDDVTGDRPRRMAIVTAPLEGKINVQVWNRINRLLTASDSIVTYLLTDTEPDRWVRKIVLAKARTMKAALKGQAETELKGKVEAPLGMAEPLGLKTAPTAREKLNATEKALEAARALPAPTEGVVRLYRFRGGEEEGGPQYYSASPAIAQAFAMREYGGEIVYTDVSKAEAETGRSKSDPGQYYLSPSGELKSLGIIPGRKSTSADVERIRNEPTQEPTVKPLADLAPGGAGAVAPQATLPAATTPNQAMRKVSVFDPLSWTLLNRARASGDPDTWRKLLLSRHEFIEQLQDMMERMIRLRALKRGKGIAGQYWPGPAPGHAGESIETLRRGSVWTVFHEMGHYFQGMVYPGKASEFPETMAQEIRRIALRAGLTETAIKKERDALNKDYGKREYGPESEAAGAAGALGRKGAEAFAQFIRLEVTNPDEAERRAPTLTKVWRETLGQHKDIKMILDWARDQWKLWEESPDEAKFDSHIVRTSGKLRWALTREDFFRMATDDIGPFTEASDQMLAGRDIDPAANPKILAETARGWIGKGYSDIEVGTHKFATPGILDGVSLKAALEPAKKRIKDFERYAVWRDEQYSRKLRENDIEDAMAAGQKPLAAWDPLEMMGLEQQWLDAVGNRLGNDPAMKRAFALTQQFADHHLEYWRDAEFFTPERTAKIKERRQIYVPLMRYMMDDLSGIGVIGGGQKAGVGAQLANIWPTIKRRFGSERPILSPVESWIKLTMLMHNRVERNEAVKAWAKLVRDHPFGGKWGVVTDEMPQEPVSVNVRDAIRKAGGNPDDLGDNLAGFVTIFRDSIKPPSPRSVWFWEGGERKMLTFRSEAVYKSVMAMDRQQWPWIVRAMQAPLRVGRASIVLGIPFQIRNIERDQITAKIRSQAAYQIWRFPKNWTEVILGHDVPRALLGGLGVSDSTIAKWNGSIRSELGTPEKREPLLQKYARAGTSMAHFMDLSYDQVVKRIERDLADIPSGKAARLAWAANPVKHARAILDALETMSLSIETATRFQEAKKFGLEKAVTRGEMLKAGHAARVLTIDFGRAGTVSRAINSIAWFFNPGVQGFSVNYQLAKDAVLHRNNRTMTQLTTRLLGALVVPTLAMYVANRDDKRYWNLPPDYRARHWIYFPFDPDSPWADVHIKFAAPHDFFGGIKAGVEDLAAWVDKQEPDKLDDFLNYMTSQSPNPMPTLPLPFIENLAPQGWKFWGERPMMGEAEARGLPEWEGVGDENVAWMAKALGRGLSIAMPPGSAGRRVVPEQFFSPRKLDNILRTLFPSIISSGTDVTEWLMGLRDKPERAIRDLVGTSAVTGESRFNTAQVGKLYDHWRIVSEIKSTLDNLKREDTHEEALRFEKENREALDQYDLLKPVIDAIGAERKEAKRLSRLEEFTPEQRREQQKAPAARAHESAQRGLESLYRRRKERYRAFAPQKPQSP